MAVVNLDAAVVLLASLYVGIARRHGIDPMVLAVQPALLALFASGLLPASNLTNLVAVARFDLGVTDVVRELAPSSLVAVVVGWIAYRRWNGPQRRDTVVAAAVDRRALRVGALVLAFLLAGFTVGASLGVRPGRRWAPTCSTTCRRCSWPFRPSTPATPISSGQCWWGSTSAWCC